MQKGEHKCAIGLSTCTTYRTREERKKERIKSFAHSIKNDTIAERHEKTLQNELSV